MNSAERADTNREDYYQDYWRAPELQASEHLRWKIELTQRHPKILAARSVLDVGSGSGNLLEALRAPGRRLCGVEMSVDAVQSLQERGMEGFTADLERDRLPFPDGAFDVALCYDVLEHVFAPGRLLGEIRRVLRPDGVAMLCVPNTLNLFNRLVFLLGEYVDVMDTSHQSEDMFSNHIRLFSKALFERFVSANGFRILERHYYFPARFSDGRFKLPPGLARVVLGPRLHARFPSLFALGFLYCCTPRL